VGGIYEEVPSVIPILSDKKINALPALLRALPRGVLSSQPDAAAI